MINIIILDRIIRRIKRDIDTCIRLLTSEQDDDPTQTPYLLMQIQGELSSLLEIFAAIIEQTPQPPSEPPGDDVPVS